MVFRPDTSTKRKEEYRIKVHPLGRMNHYGKSERQCWIAELRPSVSSAGAANTRLLYLISISMDS